MMPKAKSRTTLLMWIAIEWANWKDGNTHFDSFVRIAMGDLNHSPQGESCALFFQHH